MVIAREIIRQGVKDLHLVVHSQGQAMDLMIGAGCVRRVELAYGGTGRFAPTGIRFRKAVYSGRLEVEDYSNFQMSLRFLAGSLGLPFMPCRSGFATDVLQKERFGPEVRGRGKVAPRKMLVQDNPFSSEPDPVILLPALNPDAALLHAQYVGTEGTVRIRGLTFLDVEQAKSADRVIVTCEEIVPEERLRMDPDQNTLPPFLIDAVVPAPYGAHPTACHFFYDYDPGHLNYYRQAAQDDEAFKRYLDEWVMRVETQEQYLDKVGAGDLLRIKANSQVGYAPGLDRR
jgi:glutaconate CoA-transferase subunit A